MLLAAIMIAPLMLMKWAEAVPCSPASQQFVVKSPADASALANALDCSGGTFTVEWIGSVAVEKTIKVAMDSTLMINGSGSGGANAVADGGSLVQLFNIDGSALHLDGVDLVNGYSSFGGAVEAINAVVTATNCTFSGHSDSAINMTGSSMVLDGYVSILGNAGTKGGGMRMNDSAVQVVGVTFVGANSADDGAGIYMATSLTLRVAGYLHFGQNKAANAGGGIMSVFGSSVDVTGRISFDENHSAAGGGALLYDNSSMTLRGESSFTNNSAVAGTSLLAGGAILACFNTQTTISGRAIFAENDAHSGGAIFASTTRRCGWTEKFHLPATRPGFMVGGLLPRCRHLGADWSR